jgi:septum formation protein
VRFRALENAEIDRYLDLEPAFDCAGSFKSEGLGISLFESVQSQDPTALVGLPLIALAAALRQVGYRLP